MGDLDGVRNELRICGGLVFVCLHRQSIKYFFGGLETTKKTNYFLLVDRFPYFKRLQLLRISYFYDFSDFSVCDCVDSAIAVTVLSLSFV